MTDGTAKKKKKTAKSEIEEIQVKNTEIPGPWHYF